MERGKRLNIKPVDDSSQININDEELIKAWMKAGYTLEESIKLTEDSYINVNDIGGITAEEATKMLEEAMNKYSEQLIK